MDDLISRAAAIEYLMTNMGWHDEDGYEVDDADEKRAIITDLVNGIPAVDAVPVEPRKRANHNGFEYYHCGACDAVLTTFQPKFCHKCGRLVKWE